MAQTYINHCYFAHGFPAVKHSEWPVSIGQNLGFRAPVQTIPISDMMHMWYEEIAYYHWDTFGCDEGKMCGHYTQVMYIMKISLICYFLCLNNSMKEKKRGKRYLEFTPYVACRRMRSRKISYVYPKFSLKACRDSTNRSFTSAAAMILTALFQLFILFIKAAFGAATS